MKFRTWLSIITFALIGLIVYFSWGDIVQAFFLLWKVNVLVLLILIPIQIFSYYCNGQMIFSYLRDKGDLKNIRGWTLARMALELNFVNHVFPSGGASGFSYLTWLLTKYKVSAGRSITAQLVRLCMIFATFVVLVMISVLYLFTTHNINETVIIFSIFLIAAVGIFVVLIAAVAGNKNRLHKIVRWITNFVNKIVRKLTRGRKQAVIDSRQAYKLSNELYQDYDKIKRDKKILKKPFFWGMLSNMLDVAVIFITFLSLGNFVNPAFIFIGQGLASGASIFFITPGGMGAYETVMITFLASAGVAAGVAIAGILLARVILLLITIVFGGLFYACTLRRYGKN